MDTNSAVGEIHWRGGMDLSNRHAGLLHRLLCRVTGLTRSPIPPPRGLGVTYVLLLITQFIHSYILHPGELTRQPGTRFELAVETTLTGSGFELLPLHRSTLHARAETERGTKNKESALRRPARIPHAAGCDTGNLRAPRRMPSQ